MRSAAPMTAEELLHLALPNKLTELVRGRLMVREPPGARHGNVAAEIVFALTAHVHVHGGGRVFSTETGFKLSSSPDTVRAPDAAFVRHERLPNQLPDGYAALAPDLVVEVLSPGDRPGEVREKVADWLRAGSRLVWVIDPRRRTARVHRADGTESLIVADGTLDGEDVLRGFSCPLASIF